MKSISQYTLLSGLVAVLACGAGCKTELDNGYAVAVTVKVDASVTQAALDSVARMHVAVRGAEAFDFDYDVDAQLKAREGKFLYRPGVKAGSVTFRITLRNAVGGDVAVGESTVALKNGKTVETTVTVSAEGPTPDMTVPQPDLTTVDLVGSDFTAGPPDLTVTLDMTAPEDLTVLDLTGVVQDFTVVPDQSVVPDMVVVPDMKILADMVVVPDMVFVADMTACTGAPAAPRLIAPISTSRVTSQKPKVRWASSPTAVSYSVDFCANPSCSSVLQSVANVTALTTTPTSNLARGAKFWRVTAVNTCGAKTSDVWEMFIPGTSKTNNTSMIGAGFLDVNKDGAVDFAKSSFSGSSRFYLNSGTSLPVATPTLTIAKTIPVGNLGDINGDGFGDLFVGDTVYLGSSTGISTSSTLGPFGSSNQSAAGVGDVDGDGFGDFAVGNGNGTGTLFFGAASGTLASIALSGGIVAGAGDVDNDGFADVLASDNTSTASVHFGSASARTTLVKVSLAKPVSEGNVWGNNVAGACDIDGNGIPEVIVTTCQRTNSYVFFGGSRTFGTPVTVPQSTDNLGCPRSPGLACAGDVNGDGVDDLIAGDFGFDDTGAAGGRVSIYFGSTTSGTLDVTPDSVITATNNTEFGALQYGAAVLGLGDVNKDGFDDILFNSSKCSGDQYVYNGSSTGLSTATNGYSLKFVHAEICDADQIASIAPPLMCRWN